MKLSADVWTILGLIPPFVAAAYTSIDRWARRRRDEDAKVALELVKLKVEIEGIRKSHHLNIPEITVTPSDLSALHHPVGIHLRFFDPDVLRNTWGFRLIRRYPRWGGVFATLWSVTVGFYGVGFLFLPTAMATNQQYRQTFGPAFAVIFLGVFELAIGVYLLMQSFRIHRAKRLALNEPRA